jgi:uncharacterized protein (TIGR00730 family)
MKKSKRPVKAYRNLEFLNSPDARTIRILAEYNEPQARFRKYGIRNSIVFFGSARSKEYETTRKRLDKNKSIQESSKKLQIRLAKYHEDAIELARRLTVWSIKPSGEQSHYICSGGGPGMMEAANKGAKLAGGRSIGLNISIPTEQYPNPFISDELQFEFHYFFIRKFWFVYLAKALVIFPGGFGTLDELMEVLTLLQTGKITRNLPVIIYGTEYWNEIVNFDALVRWGTIGKEDLELIHFCDTVDSAFDYLSKRIKS